MKMIQCIGIFLWVLGFFVTVKSQNVEAFTLILGSEGQISTGWKSNTVHFDVDTSCASYLSTIESAISAASALWGSVPTAHLTISVGSTVTLSQPIVTYVSSSSTTLAPEGNPIIYCDSSFQSNSGADADSIPGFAAAQNLSSNGQMLGALLVLNVQSGASANITSFNANLLNIVLSHEIGHCLGIGHSSDKNALMYYATNSSKKLVLSKDDMDAVTYLYPRQELTSAGLMGCGTISAGSRNRGSGSRSTKFPLPPGWVELGVLGLILVLHRRWWVHGGEGDAPSGLALRASLQAGLSNRPQVGSRLLPPFESL